MNQGKTVFSQLMDFSPMYSFHQCVEKYHGDKWVQTFSCWEQFLSMAFAQLTSRSGLRDIEVSLGVQRHKLYHMGFRNLVRRNTLSNANNQRDYRIYRDFAYILIDMTRPLYAGEDLELDIKQTVYAFDSTTIDLSLRLFSWATFRKTKSAIKLHTLMDLRGSIPTFIDITSASVHDVNVLDKLRYEPGSIIVMDRAYLDFERLYILDQSGVIFVIRSKKNLRYRRIRSFQVDISTSVQCDQRIVLTGKKSYERYPQPLRRIRYKDYEKNKRLDFLTNNFLFPAQTVADIYRNRWKIELFFKWIKQNLRIKKFYGNSKNAVQTQIWIAIAVYLLVAIAKKKQNLDVSLHTMIQVFSVSLFEKVPIFQLFKNDECKLVTFGDPNQLSLLD